MGSRLLGGWCCVLVAALGWGCSDVAVDGDYQGEALFVLEGTVRLELTAQDLGRQPSGALRVALFWSGADTLSETLDVSGEEQDVETFGVFPARYALTLYEPPLDRLVTARPGATGAFAYASLMAYLDENGNQRWDRDQEPLVGGAFDRVVVFAPAGVTARKLGSLAPGYHLLGREEGVELCPEDDEEPEEELELIRVMEPETEIVVNLAFPFGAIIDLECQGGFPFSAGCPALTEVRARCDTPSQADALMCVQCTQLLSPVGGGDAMCDRWTRSCYGFSDASGCDAERYHCLELKPAPADYVCDEDLCRCQRTKDACLAANGDPTQCEQTANACFVEALGED